MNIKRKGKVVEMGKGKFGYRVRVEGRTVYLPLKSRTMDEAVVESAQYKERVQGSVENVADSLRALADRLEGKGRVSRSTVTYDQVWGDFAATHNAKPATMVFYDGHFKMLTRWLAANGCATVGDVTVDKAKAYLRHLDGDESTSGQTVDKHMVSLRMIWKTSTGSVGPWEGLKSSRKTPQVRHQPFSEDDLRLVINRADEPLRGLLMLMAYTGARLVDACRMKMISVQWRRGVIEYLPMKTGRRGSNPMMSKVGIHPALTDMLKARVGELDVLPYWSVMHKRDQSAVVKMVQAHFIACGIETTIEVRGKRQCVYGSHSFRHAVQTMLSNADVHTSVIDVILAHKTPGMGGIYTHVSDKRVIDAIAVIPNVVGGEGNVIKMPGVGA
jgi:integrase